jgi:hypothetical protein
MNARLLVGVVLLLLPPLVACKSKSQPSHDDPVIKAMLERADAAGPITIDGPSQRDLNEVARAAESASATPGSGEIHTISGIGLLQGVKVVRANDPLPPAMHGHGEALRGAWLAPDGTEFLAGYMYTGVPGPDTGVVYRREAGGNAWKMVWTKRENEVGHLWGRSSKDVWVAGVKTVAHWDGTSWVEETIPGLTGSVSGIWGDNKEVWVVGGDFNNDTDGGRIWRRDEHGAWALDGSAPAYLYDVHGVAGALIAVGNDGTILRRVKAGTWEAQGTKGGQHTSVWLASPTDMYVAGSVLLHSKGDGHWEKVALPVHAQARRVWGRSAADIYVGTLGGLLHWDGKAWSTTEWKQEADCVSGNATAVLVANQSMKAER